MTPSYADESRGVPFGTKTATIQNLTGAFIVLELPELPAGREGSRWSMEEVYTHKSELARTSFSAVILYV